MGDLKEIGETNAVEAVNFEWLHLSESEEEYEVFDYEVRNSDLYPYKNKRNKIATKKSRKYKEDEAPVEAELALEIPEVAPRYYNALKIYPETQILLDNFHVIAKEAENLIKSNAWTPWPEENLYGGDQQNGDWKVIPLLYTFPAYDPSSSKWVGSNEKLCPKTCSLLRKLPGIRTALFSRLGAQTRISAHQGWAELANHVLRCHLPLSVPENSKNLCGMWVEGHVNYHKEKQFLVFDDSKWHKAFNATSDERIILLFDLIRPQDIPKGGAKAGKTEQLEQFITAFEALQTE